MDPDTLAQAFDLPAPPADVEDDDEETMAADESDLDADVAMAFDTEAAPDERREAFVRAVRAAMKG
jgi:queuine/archaeosine tRNA-ribosyltransferase